MTTLHVISWYVLGALTLLLVLEFLYRRWSGKRIPSWTVLPWIVSFSMLSGMWFRSGNWEYGIFYLLLTFVEVANYFKRLKSEKKDTSWKEMFR